MTMTSTTRREPFVGNGVSVSFAVPFGVFELGVYLDGVLQPDDGSVYTFTQAETGQPGTVVFVSPPGSGVEVVLLGETDAVQSLDFVNNDDFDAESLERALDRLTAIVIERDEVGETAIRRPADQGPFPALDFKGNPNTFLRINADGDPELTSNAEFLSVFASEADQAVEDAQEASVSAESQADAAAASAAAAADSAASALSSAGSLDDRYLGAFPTDPTTNNTGGPIAQGALYYNTGTSQLRIYQGASWSDVQNQVATTNHFHYTSSAAQVTFSGLDDHSNSLTYAPGHILVHLNGVLLRDGVDYTADDGTTIDLDEAAALNDELHVLTFTPFVVADTYTTSEIDTLIAGVTAANGLPEGGTVGQRLVKGSATDYDVVWMDDPVPAGGTVGQVLAKASGDDHDTTWVDAATGGGGGGSNPNLLINPAMTINEREFAGGALSAGNYGFDRWKAATGGANMSATAGVVTLTSGEIEQVIEPSVFGLASFDGLTIAVSCSDPSQELTCTFGGVTATIPAGSGQQSDTLVASGAGNASFKVKSTSGAAVTFSDLKVEVADAATPFIPRPLPVEQFLCWRYLFVIRDHAGHLCIAPRTSNASNRATLLTPAPMRALPTLTYAQNGNKARVYWYGGGSYPDVNSMVAHSISGTIVTFNCTMQSDVGVGDGNLYLYAVNELFFDAEL